MSLLFASVLIFLLFILHLNKAAINDTGTSLQSDASLNGNANEFVDEMMVHWRLLLRESGYDPLKVDSFSKSFISCWNCIIEGLSTIHRTGDVTLNASQSFIIMDLNVGLEFISARCDCEARWAIFSAGGSMTGTLTNYNVAGRIEQYAEPRSPPTATSLRITNQGELSTRFSGNGFFGTLLEWFGQEFIRKRIKELIHDASAVREQINRGLAKTDLTKALSL